jgi:hypothetical protein
MNNLIKYIHARFFGMNEKYDQEYQCRTGKLQVSMKIDAYEA